MGRMMAECSKCLQYKVIVSRGLCDNCRKKKDKIYRADDDDGAAAHIKSDKSRKHEAKMLEKGLGMMRFAVEMGMPLADRSELFDLICKLLSEDAKQTMRQEWLWLIAHKRAIETVAEEEAAEADTEEDENQNRLYRTAGA